MTTPKDIPPIPIVDFGAFLHGNEEERADVARQIDDAFRNTGFVYLKNHGVEKEVVDKCFEWSKKFFALPMETKMLAPHPPGGSHHRGYSAPGVEKVSQHEYDADELKKLREIPDFKESFESGNPTDTSQPNIWPPDTSLPGLRPFLESFFTHCKTLTHSILSALSLALRVPSPGLSPTHSASLFQLRLLHYPAIHASELANNQTNDLNDDSKRIGRARRSRINAHSDFGTLTLLFQDRVGGLEIGAPDTPGLFRPAPPIEGTVLVNVGDLLARWSNDRWRSTVHRVGLPPAISSVEGEKQADGEEKGEGREGMVPDRYSIPFFATADMETVIDALPGCWDEAGNPKRYEPVTAWGYVQMRMAALYNS